MRNSLRPNGDSEPVLLLEPRDVVTARSRPVANAQVDCGGCQKCDEAQGRAVGRYPELVCSQTLHRECFAISRIGRMALSQLAIPLRRSQSCSAQKISWEARLGEVKYVRTVSEDNLPAEKNAVRTAWHLRRARRCSEPAARERSSPARKCPWSVGALCQHLPWDCVLWHVSTRHHRNPSGREILTERWLLYQTPHALLDFASSGNHPLSCFLTLPVSACRPAAVLPSSFPRAPCATSSIVTPSSRRYHASSSSCRCATDFSVAFDIEIASSSPPTASPLPLSCVLPPPAATALLLLFHSSAATLILLTCLLLGAPLCTELQLLPDIQLRTRARLQYFFCGPVSQRLSETPRGRSVPSRPSQ